MAYYLSGIIFYIQLKCDFIFESSLSNELNTVEKQLKEKIEERKKYREKYIGGLPEQLHANLSILEGLRQQLDQYNSNLRDAENRKLGILKDI